MNVNVSESKVLAGTIAASHGGMLIQQAIARKGECCVVLATGASQFDMLKHLVSLEFIDWSKVTCYEYIGIDDSHSSNTCVSDF
eukprot:m.198160 g.198160  ORF g.198160 m.198160 type:complete len:84 (+) comp39558_c0_seq9:231-482(+)